MKKSLPLGKSFLRGAESAKILRFARASKFKANLAMQLSDHQIGILVNAGVQSDFKKSATDMGMFTEETEEQLATRVKACVASRPKSTGIAKSDQKPSVK